jgi:hypothetical protein
MEFVVLKYLSLKVAIHLKQQQIRALGAFFFFWNSSGLCLHFRKATAPQKVQIFGVGFCN